MVLELKLRKIGNSVGLALPKQVLAHLKVGEGDTFYLITIADDSVRLTNNSNLAKQMKATKSLMRRYDNTLRELAKH